MTDIYGDVVKEYKYDAFGNLLENTDSYSKVTSISNLLGNASEIGYFESGSGSGFTLVSIARPDTGKSVRAICLNSGAVNPVINAYLSLLTNTDYIIEFDYWCSSGSATFDCDLWPDDLPQICPTATTTLQHYRWEISSSSSNMASCYLRFFNDIIIPNPTNIYITNIRVYEKNDNNPYRYCGEYYDLETNTYYLRARNYDPTTGRFLSEDNIRGKCGDPLSLNLYTYCQDNPILWVDPSGNTVKTFFRGLARAIDEYCLGGILSFIAGTLDRLRGNEPSDWDAEYKNDTDFKNGYDTGTLISIAGIISSGLKGATAPQEILVTDSGLAAIGQSTSGATIYAVVNSSGKEDDKSWNTVVEEKSVSNNLGSLSSKQKEIYYNTLEKLAKDDTSGLNVHTLKGNQKGKLSADLKGFGGNRGNARIYYTNKDGIITITDIVIQHQ